MKTIFLAVLKQLFSKAKLAFIYLLTTIDNSKKRYFQLLIENIIITLITQEVLKELTYFL